MLFDITHQNAEKMMHVLEDRDFLADPRDGAEATM